MPAEIEKKRLCSHLQTILLKGPVYKLLRIHHRLLPLIKLGPLVFSRQLTADAAYADIVLPATTMFEIDSYMTSGPIFRLREKIIGITSGFQRKSFNG